MKDDFYDYDGKPCEIDWDYLRELFKDKYRRDAEYWFTCHKMSADDYAEARIQELKDNNITDIRDYAAFAVGRKSKYLVPDDTYKDIMVRLTGKKKLGEDKDDE